MLSTSATNYGKYSNPQIDQILIAQDSELDQAKRRSILWEAQRLQLADLAVVPLFYAGGVFGTRPNVFGYIPPPKGAATSSAFRLEAVWLGA